MSRKLQVFGEHLRNNKGIALVSVLVVSTVLALVGSSYLSTSTHEAGLINQQVSSAQLLYAADAGVAMGKRTVSEAIAPCATASLEDGQVYAYSNQFTIPGKSESVQLAVQVSPSGSDYNLTSTAEYNGVQKKLSATLSKSDASFPLYDYGIYAKEVVYGDEDGSDSERLVRVYRRLAPRRWGLWFPHKRAMVRLKQTCRNGGCHNNYYMRRARYYYGSTGYWKFRKMKSTGLTETVLTDSHADFKWREEISGVGKFNLTATGWQLVPNVKQPDKVYPITAYTRHTITVSSPMCGGMLADGASVGDRYRIERVFAADPAIKFYTYDSSDQNTPITLVDRATVVKEDNFSFPILSGNGFNDGAFISEPGVPASGVATTATCSGLIDQDQDKDCADGEELGVNYICQIKNAMRKHRGQRTILRVLQGTAKKVYKFRGNTLSATKNTLIGRWNKVKLEGNSTLIFPDDDGEVRGLTLAPHAELEISGNPAVIRINGHLHLGFNSKLTINGDAYIVVAGHLRIDRRATLQVNKTTGTNGNLTIISSQPNVKYDSYGQPEGCVHVPPDPSRAGQDWVDSDPAIFLAGSKWQSKGGSLVTDGDLVIYNPEGNLVVKRRGQLKVGGNATFNLKNFIVKRKGLGNRHRNRTLSIQTVDAAAAGSTATLMTKCDKNVPHIHFKPTDDDDDDEDKNEDGTTTTTTGALANRKHYCKGHHFPAEVTKSRSCRGNAVCHAGGGGGRWARLWKPRHPAAFLNYLGATNYFEVDIAGETILATHGGIYLYHGNLRFGDATAAPPTTLVSYGDMHLRRSNVLFNGDLDIDAGDGSLGTNNEPEDSFIMFTGKYAAVKFAGKAMIEHNGAYMDLSRSKLAIGDEKVEIYGNRVINLGGQRGLLNVLKLSKISNWASWRDFKFDYTKYLPDQMRLKDTSKLLIYNTGSTEDGARTLTKRTFFGQIYSPCAEVEITDLSQALEDRIPSYFWGAIATNQTVTLHKQLKFYYDLALEDTTVATVSKITTSQWEVVPPSSQ